jgi:hypothetical protein
MQDNSAAERREDPSVFSRTTTKSITGDPLSGTGTPSSRFAGRMPANRSSTIRKVTWGMISVPSG